MTAEEYKKLLVEVENYYNEAFSETGFDLPKHNDSFKDAQRNMHIGVISNFFRKKLESITDEMIEKEFPSQEKSFFQEEMVDRQIGAKWFKEQLLKQ